MLLIKSLIALFRVTLTISPLKRLQVTQESDFNTCFKRTLGTARHRHC